MSNLSKNLRREVRRQLKELRGGVGEQASLATKTMTMTKINEDEKIVNCDLSIVNCNRPSLPELEQFVRRDYDLRYRADGVSP